MISLGSKIIHLSNLSSSIIKRCLCTAESTQKSSQICSPRSSSNQRISSTHGGLCLFVCQSVSSIRIFVSHQRSFSKSDQPNALSSYYLAGHVSVALVLWRAVRSRLMQKRCHHRLTHHICILSNSKVHTTSKCYSHSYNRCHCEMLVNWFMPYTIMFLFTLNNVLCGGASHLSLWLTRLSSNHLFTCLRHRRTALCIDEFEGACAWHWRTGFIFKQYFVF